MTYQVNSKHLAAFDKCPFSPILLDEVMESALGCLQNIGVVLANGEKL